MMDTSIQIEGLKFTFKESNFFIEERDCLNLLKKSFPLNYGTLDHETNKTVVGLFHYNFPSIFELVYLKVYNEIETPNNFLLLEVKRTPK